MNIIKYILSASFVVTLVSCKKFLDVEPKESVPDNLTIFDKTSAEEAVRGIYSALGNGGYYGTSFQSIGYLSGDNIQWTGSQSQIQEFINHNVSPDNATIGAAWGQIYVTINRANHVIAKLPSVEHIQLTTAYKNQLLGEAYFLRALAYFDLVRTWGGVPLIVNPTLTATDNVGIERSTKSETYAQVLADLNKAETLLPVTTNRYRATAKTVWALKARYYLYQGDWTNAETYATKIIEDAVNYQLKSPYNSFYANSARGTVESIFEIYYNGTTESNGHGGQWLPQTLGGTRQWAPNTVFVNLDTSITIGGNRKALVAQDNQNRWYGTLYGSTTASGSYVIRIAELYLIRAEARAKQNNLSASTGALSDLNAVRTRAGLAASTAITQDDVLLAIENERRIEFAFEPHRWFDLVRSNRAAAVLGVTDANKLLLPLPGQQILLDNALKQNPGY
jgi:tetratricopeptide (TPR) repeat protein